MNEVGVVELNAKAALAKLRTLASQSRSADVSNETFTIAAYQQLGGIIIDIDNYVERASLFQTRIAAMVAMLENKEWAEGAAVSHGKYFSELALRLENCITELHNELHEKQNDK